MSSTASVDRVLNLIDKLPPDEKRAVRRALLKDREEWWQKTAAEGVNDMRRLARDRGKDWDSMSENEREEFVDLVLHEPV